MSIVITAGQLDVIVEALGDAFAYRTESGEVHMSELEEYEREACERYLKLADELGVTFE